MNRRTFFQAVAGALAAVGLGKVVASEPVVDGGFNGFNGFVAIDPAQAEGSGELYRAIGLAWDEEHKRLWANCNDCVRSLT